MKRALWALLCCGAASGAYTWYYTDAMTSLDPSKWVQNGAVSFGTAGMNMPGSGGGSLISRLPAPDGSSDYELRVNLTMKSSGGYYFLFLRASDDALLGPAGARGTFYAVVLDSPVLSNGACSATLRLQRYVNGAGQELAASAVGCGDGVQLRAYIYGSRIEAFTNEIGVFTVSDAAIPTG